MSAQWYVLRSKPHKEHALWREGCAREFEVFYPRLRVKPVNPRSRKVRPYFPGYLFVHVDLKALGESALAWLPYSQGLVSFAAEPAPVPDSLIAAVRRRVEEANQRGEQKTDGLTQGDAVMIERGPFAGYQAIFDARVSGNERVRVLLKLLNRVSAASVPLELEAEHIRKVSPVGSIQYKPALATSR